MVKLKYRDYLWFLPDAKRPFAGSRGNTRELIRFDAERNFTVKQCREHYARYKFPFNEGFVCQEVLDILDVYIKLGLGDYPVAQFLPEP